MAPSPRYFYVDCLFYSAGGRFSSGAHGKRPHASRMLCDDVGRAHDGQIADTPFCQAPLFRWSTIFSESRLSPLREHALKHDPEKWKPVFQKVMLHQKK
jgi:fructosamine-3-kinase